MPLYTVAGTGSPGATDTTSIGSYVQQVGSGVNSSIWTWKPIGVGGTGTYPAKIYPISTSIADGVSSVIAAINGTPGNFGLVGYSQGAWVISEVLQQLQTGSLTARMSNLVGGVTFGNPMRQTNHTIPGGTNPGLGSGGVLGVGNLLTSTPSQWWDFADPQDPVTVQYQDTTGADWAAGFQLLVGSSNGPTQVVNLFIESFTTFPSGSFMQMVAIARIAEQLFGAIALGPNAYTNYSSHTSYGFPYPLLAGGLSAVQLAINYLNTL